MQLGSVELPDQYSSVCEDLPSPDKRHSWVWTGEASGKKVGEEFRTVLVRTQHASSVEVLKRDRSGDKESFDLVIMGPQWEPEETGLKYSSDLASPDHASHASHSHEAVKKQADILVADMGELREMVRTATPMNGGGDTYWVRDNAKMGNGRVLMSSHEEKEEEDSEDRWEWVAREVTRSLMGLILVLFEAVVWGLVYAQLEEGGGRVGGGGGEEEQAEEVIDTTSEGWSDIVLAYLLLPTVVTSVIWLGTNVFNKNYSCLYFTYMLLAFSLSIPSPIFL